MSAASSLLGVALGLLGCTASARESSQTWKWAFDGHARTMYESYRGLDFGLGPVAADNWVHQRVQFMGTLRHGDALEVAPELTWGRMWGKESTLAPPDEDEVDILQLHLQGRLPVGEDALEFRAGRQTLYYGSGRLLAAREGANQRLVHDALRLSWLHGKDTRVDAFIASPVEVRPDAFDNESEPQRVRFWSLYAVLPLGVFDEEDLIHRTHELAEFVQEASEFYRFSAASVDAVGYSNGANIAGALLLLRPGIARAAALLRPMLPIVPDPLPQLGRARGFIAAGNQDPIVPAENTGELVTLLERCGADVTVFREDAGHGLTNETLVRTREWLLRA